MRPSTSHRVIPLLVLAVTLGLAAVATAQTVIFEKPPSPAGGVLPSAWLDPDGSDADMYVYDDFTLPATAAITQVRWRGGYLYGGIYGRVWNFTLTFYASAVGGSQPACGNPQLPETYLAFYDVGGTANETAAGTVGGVQMYDYRFDLPTAFVATGLTKYWIRIEASQVGYPDWGPTVGTGGDDSHYQFSTGSAHFSYGSHDAAFALLTSSAPSFVIAASESPPGSGTISGAGPYPQGATASLTATPNAGFGFVDWTENGAQVSTSPTYAFTVNTDRTLVANFTTAWTIATGVSPEYGGSVAGAGRYNDGTTVHLQATPAPGFVFVDWTEFGTEVSTAADYSFPAVTDQTLVANFTPATGSAFFDFDTGSPALSAGQSVSFVQTAGGIAATFGSPQGPAFSVQSDASTYYHLSHFSGNYLYPNNLNRNTLEITFDHDLTGIYLVFATTDNHQTEVPTPIQLAAYKGSSPTPVGTASAHGTYAFDTFPMGTLSFNSPAPFDRVQIVVPYQPLGATAFFVDDITAALVAPAAVPAAPPASTQLLAPAPNPMCGSTVIAFDLPVAAPAVVAVYDAAGRRVRELRSGSAEAGRHLIRWDGRDEHGAPAAAGLYLVRLETAGHNLVRRVAVLR